MAAGTSDETAFPSSKPAKGGKEAKGTKEPREGKKPKDETGGSSGEGKNSTLLRQMAADLADLNANLHRLQSDVDTLKGGSGLLPAVGGERSKKGSKGSNARTAVSGPSAVLSAAFANDPALDVVLAVRPETPEDNSNTAFICAPDQAALRSVDTAQAARLGYAFSSVPKIALIRMLLENGEQTAAQLGEGAGLTTGSLYHHLRELVHAEVAYQSSRNRYALTPLGRRTALVFLALLTAP